MCLGRGVDEISELYKSRWLRICVWTAKHGEDELAKQSMCTYYVVNLDMYRLEILVLRTTEIERSS